VLTTNRFMQERRKVPGTTPLAEPDHHSRVTPASGEGQVVIEHYRLTREQQIQIRAQRAARDAAWVAARKARRDGNA